MEVEDNDPLMVWLLLVLQAEELTVTTVDPLILQVVVVPEVGQGL